MTSYFGFHFKKKSLTSIVKSRWVEFLSRSISRLNLVSFTSNLPNSFNTDEGSDPTSSRNTRPNNSTHNLQRPNRELAEVPLQMTGLEEEVDAVGLTVDSELLPPDVEGSTEDSLSVTRIMRI